ncbi:MAG: tetratricopeptide repeat protein [Halioglobus sp.]
MPRLLPLIAALLLIALPSWAFTGSETCRECHAEEHSMWQGSHHDLAMQEVNESTVLGDFDNATFTYNGVSSRFYRKEGKFMVSTDGEDGEVTEFEVRYVFGVYPLQQYLLPLSRGRLQTLTIAWDSRPVSEGGQRWFNLQTEDGVDYRDPLHWTGPYYNWNTRCAECHSTDVRKNYDLASRSFNTTFEDIDVGCEACHGPGDKHVELAGAGKLDSAAHAGFPMSLAERGTWTLAEGESIATRSEPLESRTQIDNCGRCHSRRGTLGDYHYGRSLLDTHRLSLPEAPLYYPDGQILDEVYVYGSFVQSKMHQAGVVCSNCHEPHSMELRAPGNGVCAQCHVPATYDTVEHHHHEPGTAGASCANCHMPETTYMVVDPRRDHSMRVPRPDLSAVIGTPNACNQCHTDRDALWAVDALRTWGVEFRNTATHPARAFHSFQSGDTRALPSLAAIAGDPGAPAIWRATAMESLGQVGGREALQTATQLIYDDDPLLRVSTIRGLQFLPVHQRYQLLTPLMNDEVTGVRLEVARSLAAVPLDQIPAEQAAQLQALYEEFITIHTTHADMPFAQVQLALFLAERGQVAEAEKAYREALALNPQLLTAYLNLADLKRAQSQDNEARQLLMEALALAPDNGPVLHSLGLLETRSGNTEKALDYLGRAAAVETGGIRHRFVYAIALHDLGKPREAIAQLQQLLRVAPGNADVEGALRSYQEELKRTPAGP